MIKQNYVIAAPAARVWAALTDPKLIEKWSGAPALMSEKSGASFKLWDGDVWGSNTQVIKHEVLGQDWFGNDWATPSKVLIKLIPNDNETVIELTHTEVPVDEEQNFANGWNDYYFGPIKDLLETA